METGNFRILWFVEKNVYRDPKAWVICGRCVGAHPRPHQPKSGQTKTQANKVQDRISIRCFPHVFGLWCLSHCENSDFDSFLLKFTTFTRIVFLYPNSILSNFGLKWIQDSSAQSALAPYSPQRPTQTPSKFLPCFCVWNQPAPIYIYIYIYIYMYPFPFYSIYVYYI